MANEDAGRKRQVSATDQNRARAAGSRKPGVVNRMMDQCRDTVESIRLPKADWRTFAWGLLLLILIIFIVGNWAPLRINFFGWYLDAPRAVVFAIFFGLGMVATWLLEMRGRRSRAPEEPEEAEELPEVDEDDILLTEIPPEEFEPGPGDFASATATPAAAEEDDEVLPGPADFAEAPELEEDGASAHFDEPLVGDDETAGDALSEDYSFRSPSEASEDEESLADDEVLSDEDWDAEQDTATDESDEESSDEDDSRTPFWRM